jgi:3-deoxy-7-phosphoheptulonate synthase
MIVMKTDASQEDILRVVAEVEGQGLRAAVIRGEYQTVIGPVGDERKLDFDRLSTFTGVKEAVRVEAPYKLISKEYARFFGEPGEHRTITIGNVHVGNGEPVIMAGPCAVESRARIMRIAEEVKRAGAHVLRGGIFKPRSSVHSFQGVGSSGIADAQEALSWLRAAGDAFDMPIVTEVRGESTVDLIAEYVDLMHIGARNMYDQDLLVDVARKGKPVLLKRHFGAGVEELLQFSEYIAAEGNKDIIMCERGIVPVGKGKSFTRYTLDLAAVPVIHNETYLPVIVDPSHGTGRQDLIFDMSCAAVAAGADGLMIESHYNPAEALVDGPQMVTPAELKEIIDACRTLYRARRAAPHTRRA